MLRATNFEVILKHLPDAFPVTPDLIQWFNAHWSHQMGAVDGKDINFLAALMAEASPTRIVEIGCASGLSTVVLSLLAPNDRPVRIDSFDISSTFYADPTKPLGYLVENAPKRTNVSVNVHAEKTAADLHATLGGEVADFCFIDANHSHPRPILDTLVAMPDLQPGAYVVHHDYVMYRDIRRDVFACGPKILFDQVPERDRVWYEMKVDSQTRKTHMMSRAEQGNIIAFRRPKDLTEMAWNLAQGLYLPWDPLRNAPMDASEFERTHAILQHQYSADVSEAFSAAFDRYGQKDGAGGSRVKRAASGLVSRVFGKA